MGFWSRDWRGNRVAEAEGTTGERWGGGGVVDGWMDWKTRGEWGAVIERPEERGRRELRGREVRGERRREESRGGDVARWTSVAAV